MYFTMMAGYVLKNMQETKASNEESKESQKKN